MGEPPANPTLLERVAQGDASAVAEVIETYGDLVWSLALRFTGSQADAEEVVQDFFVSLWRKADKFDRNAGQEVTFVSVLARRFLIDRWRRLKARPAPTGIEHLVHAPDESASSDPLASEAVRAFEHIEDELKILLRLSIELGYSHTEIAELTGEPLGTIKSKLRRGLSKIRERLTAEPAPGPSRAARPQPAPASRDNTHDAQPGAASREGGAT